MSLTALITSTSVAYGQDTAKGGAQKLMQARALKSGADVQKLKAGDLVVETCPKCMMTSYKRLDGSAKGGGLATMQDSKCPACGVDMKSDNAKHMCKMCGAEMICCVIPGSVSSGTGSTSSDHDHDDDAHK